MQIVCLAGGVGAARFLLGLREAVTESNLTAIVNTGDDDEFYGLHVSPDIDIICYTLAGIVDEEKGWGIKDDTFKCLGLLERYGNPVWFRIGDMDFATHIERTRLLKAGLTLTDATKSIASRLGVRCAVLPMSDSPVRTKVRTPSGRLNFQEYFVRDRFQHEVLGVEFAGIEEARPTENVKAAVHDAEGIIICPSNPIVSIGPIVSLKNIRNLLRMKREQTVAVSPIVGGRTIKGPADDMMRSLGHEVSAFGVAQLYRDIASTILIDKQDRNLKGRIERLGMNCIATDTIMRSRERKIQLADAALRSLSISA